MHYELVVSLREPLAGRYQEFAILSSVRSVAQIASTQHCCASLQEDKRQFEELQTTEQR